MKTEHPLQSDNSKVISRSVNTFIPLGDETINSSLVERSRSLMNPQPYPPCTSSSERNLRSRMSFFRYPKMWKSQGERSGLYGGCWSLSQPNPWSLSLTGLAVWGWALSCKSMILSNRIPGHFDFMVHCSTLSHQEMNHRVLASFYGKCSNIASLVINKTHNQWRLLEFNFG